MALEKNFVTFRLSAAQPKGDKTYRWEVVSTLTRMVVGYVQWQAQWRRYILNPNPNSVWDGLCLATVSEFLDRQMAARKAGQGKPADDEGHDLA